MLKSRIAPRFVLVVLWPVVDRVLRAIYHIRPLRVDDDSIVGMDFLSFISLSATAT